MLMNLGEAYQMRGQEREAIQVLEKAYGLGHQNRSTLFHLAVSYVNIEKVVYTSGMAVRPFISTAGLPPQTTICRIRRSVSMLKTRKLFFQHDLQNCEASGTSIKL